jgi:hypothetical protein
MKRFSEYSQQDGCEDAAGSFFQRRSVVANALCGVLIEIAGFEK